MQTFSKPAIIIIVVVIAIMLAACGDNTDQPFDDGQLHDWIITNNEDGFPSLSSKKPIRTQTILCTVTNVMTG